MTPPDNRPESNGPAPIRRDRQRLDDVERACTAIRAHLDRGALSDDLVFDAVCMRLVEIGESASAMSPELLATEPDIPWRQVIGMRHRLAHRYFETARSIVEATVTGDLHELAAATRRMIERVEKDAQ